MASGASIDITDEQKAAAAGLGLSAAELADMSAEDLQNKLAQKQASEKLGTAMESIKNTLVSALLPAAEALMGVFQLLSPILGLVVEKNQFVVVLMLPFQIILQAS